MSHSFLRTPHIACLYLAYYIVLQFSYAFVESVLYSEVGMRYQPPNLFYQLIGLVMVMIPPLLVNLTFERPSHLVYTILYLTVFVPSMFIPYHVLDLPPGEILILCSSLLAMFLLLAVFCKLPIVELNPPKLTERQVISLLIVTSALLTLLCAASSGFRLQLSLQNIYERRADAREAVLGGTLAAYGIATLSSSVGPLLLAIGYLRKNIYAIVVGAIGMLSVFSFSGTKRDLVAPIFMLGIFFVVSQNRDRRRATLLTSAIGLIILSVVQFLVFDRFEISVYLCRRIIIFPATITSFYWEFFSQHEHVYYSDSFLRWALKSPYDLPMARLMGEEFFGSDQANVNANVWASAFGHMGYSGMLVTTLGLGCIFRLLDSLAKNAGYRVVSMMGGLFAISWSNGAFETTMLSNGVFVSIVIFYLLPTEKSGRHPLRHAAVNNKRSCVASPTTGTRGNGIARE